VETMRKNGRASDQDGEPHIDWTAQDWGELVPRLLLHVRSRLTRTDLLGALQAEDLVQDAIAKTFARTRIWNPQTCTFFRHLAGVIDSEISHAANSMEARLTGLGNGRRPKGTTGPPPEVPNEAPNQEERALRLTEVRRLLEYLEHIDPKLAQLAGLILEGGLDQTRDLCRELAVVPREVANLRKRLWRAVRTRLESQR
jgi:DNA-directed RNA polymerase specialized sigma24 family protein